MNPTVQCETVVDIAVVRIANPPVNALKHEVRVGLMDVLADCEARQDIRGIVLVGAGRNFVAGADIRELGGPPRPPIALDVIAMLESASKPVVAAMHGPVLGAGLELAMACHYRLATGDAHFGLPEVKLGLIPGAGGTQRLPRAVGVEHALKMVVSGEPITADEALGWGLIDAIVAGDLLQEAIDFARLAADEGMPLRRLRDDDSKLEDARADPSLIDRVGGALTSRRQGFRAPLVGVEAVRQAVATDFDTAMRHERQRFLELAESDQSKALRYLFFAEREAAKFPHHAVKAVGRQVHQAAVIGAGTMGCGIAIAFANAGIPVILIDVSPQALARGRDTIADIYARGVKRNEISLGEAQRRSGLMMFDSELAAAATADFVIEAVYEEIGLKQQVMEELDRLTPRHAILATNTSYLDVDVIARATTRPSQVIGTHFFSPAHVMRLLELVEGAQTEPSTVATAVALGRRLGKLPVTVGVCHGFVGNRMLWPRFTEAQRLVLEGATLQDVDAALVEFGFPMGQFAVGDLAGLDVGWRMRKAHGLTAIIADALCERGRFGQKTGQGFYKYEAGSRAPLPDSQVEVLIGELAAFHGFSRRRISSQEIIERLIFPMINEGARILDEAIARRASDIDLIWVNGFGWPAWRGGPMHYANQVGLTYIRDRLEAFARQTGDSSLHPARLLRQLAESSAPFEAVA